MKKVLALVAMVFCGFALSAATQGSCPQAAKAIQPGFSGTVTLVKEYDSDWGEYSDWGVYYLKVQLQKGHAYTVYIEGGNAETIWVGIDPREETDAEFDAGIFAPWAGFNVSDVQGGRYMNWMYADDWSSSDPSSWDYYISLSGDVGDKTTLHFEEGIISYKAKGLSDNPESITLNDSEQTFARKITEEGSYYFRSTLQEGRKYNIRTAKGTEAVPFKLSVTAYDFISFDSSANPDYAEDKYNEAYIVAPHETGSFEFVVSGGSENQAFDFVGNSVPARKIADHPYTELAAGGEATFRPGRENAGRAYSDNVIDEQLFLVHASKGERWVFDAIGADRAVEMRLYDAKGNVLAKNGTVGNGSHDVRIGVDAAANADYYVGVCDPALGPDDSAVCAQTTLKARTVVPADGEGVLNPLPGTAASDPLVAGAVSDPCALTDACWAQTFAIAGRKNLGYKFATSFVGASSDLSIKAEVFRLSSSRKETAVKADGDNLTPGKVVSFTADANDTYYLRLSVAQGKGLEFPEFTVHSVAYSTTGSDLGTLTVNIKGPAAATWSIGSESAKYPSGASVLLAGKQTVKFNSVKDFTTPASETVTVVAGSVPTVVTGVYNDTADPADDYASGSATVGGKKVTYKPVSWSLKNTESGYDRTLWTNDVADTFTFDGKDGYFYDFALAGVTGDAVISITNATPYNGNNGVFALGETSVSKVILPASKTKYYLIVSHGNETPTDGVYRVTGKYANVGAIKFGSVAVKAKEDAASVKLTVKRTAKDGRVRVKYATVADTAQPGKDYYAQSGVLEWADGDNKDKTIEIKLIPDLVAAYEGADHQFTVKLEPIPEDERAADEYEAAFTVDSKTGATLDTATITLTETAKAVPGTVQVADSATPKKPVYDVKAGAKLVIPFTRTVGGDGIVGVKVETVKGKALPGVDYVEKVEQFVWQDGESDTKEFAIDLLASKDTVASKNFTLKLTALTGSAGAGQTYAKPTLAASSVTVNVLNDQFAQTVADWAKALPKTDGVQAKESASGTWFYIGDDDAGRPQLKHIGKASKLTLTLTGPCKLLYSVNGVEQEPFDMMEGFVGKTKAFDLYNAKADEDVTVAYEYLYNGGEYVPWLQALKYGYDTPIADGTAAGLKVSSGKLPDGLKLEQDKTTKEWFVRGVPTKGGYFYAEIQDKNKNAVTNLAVYVQELGTAVGTFNGILTEDGSALTNFFPSVGTVQLTTTTAGKLTAKVTIAGSSYSFSGTGFDAVYAVEPDVQTLTASLELTKKVGSVTYTNVINVSVKDAAVTNLAVLGSVVGSVELTMAVPDTNNKGAQEDIRYTADLYRDNTKSDEYLAAFAAVKGYYTAALPILNPEWGKPQGNGYLTFTVDDKGKCKTAGKLADGTSVSSSLVPALIGDLANPDGCELVVPVFQAKKPAVFGGLIRIHLADCGDAGLVPVVDSSALLRWASDDDATKSYDGTGWNYDLAPAGGWYDTVVNLQAYYLSSTFALDAGQSDDLPEELLTAGYSFVSSTMPTGESVDLAGDTLNVAKQALVKKLDEKGKATSLYDWEQCVNPSGVKLTFKRATGVVSGSFDVWSEGVDSRGNTVQKKVSGFKHEGVLLLSRDAFSPLADEVWTAGYFLTPSYTSPDTKKKVTDSYQFNIIREDQGDLDWWEGDGGWNPEWGDPPPQD